MGLCADAPWSDEQHQRDEKKGEKKKRERETPDTGEATPPVYMGGGE